MDEQQQSSKKWIIIGIVLVLIIAGVVVFFLFSKKGTDGAGGVKSIGQLFGQLGNDTARPQGGDIMPGTSVGDSGGDVTEEPLFRQLSTIKIAGATAVVRDGKIYVRYVAKENAAVYEVDPTTGSSVQLTNTTIPRIYEALWANNGNSVVLRYLTRDPLSRKDVIKTYLANLTLPIESMSSTSASVGSLVGDFLPDDITAVSVSPDGTRLFYLLPVAEGVSGTVVNVFSKNAKEIFRSTFSEWLPQLLNDGTVILTTKPSAEVSGFSYLYDPANKSLSRILREKNGLTTLPTASGVRVLYSENVLANTTLGYYDAKGFSTDQGEVTHSALIQLATLAEKCAWSKNGTRIYCGAFSSTPRAKIPDDWYQGTLAFTDTFWTVDTDTTQLVFLADPQKEKGVERSFDVFMPFTGGSEDRLFFTDKNDGTLWSMRLIKDKYMTNDEPPIDTTSTLPSLTPSELKDAQGSAQYATTSTTTSKKASVKSGKSY